MTTDAQRWPVDKPPANKDAVWAAYSRQRYRRVLELGPLDGRDTMHLACHARNLSVIESRVDNIAATRRTCEENGVYNVTYYLGNLESYDLAKLGTFDAVWCVGVLYHLPQPWRLVKQLASATRLVYGWSHLAEKITETREGWRGRPYQESGLADPLSGMSPTSFWLTPDEFHRMFAESGFAFQWLKPPAPHENGGLAGQFMVTR